MHEPIESCTYDVVIRLRVSPQIFSNSPNNYLHRTDRYKRALAKAVRARQLEEQLNLSEEDAMILRACICDDLPTTLHTLMFLPGLLSIFDDEQQKHWVPLARAYKVCGRVLGLPPSPVKHEVPACFLSPHVYVLRVPGHRLLCADRGRPREQHQGPPDHRHLPA